MSAHRDPCRGGSIAILHTRKTRAASGLEERIDRRIGRGRFEKRISKSVVIHLFAPGSCSEKNKLQKAVLVL